MKTYTNTSNTARAAKAELAKALGLDKKDVVKGEHFNVVPVEGGFQWEQIKVAGEFTVCPSCKTHLDNGYQTAENMQESGNPIGHEYVCLACEHEFGAEVVVEAPKAKPAKGTGLKIQKDRDEKNGIKRPSEGGICARLWEMFEQHYAETGMILTPKPAKEISAKEGLDPTTTTVQLYRWRDYMGF